MAQKYIWLNGYELPIEGEIIWDRVTPFPEVFATAPPDAADYTPTRTQKLTFEGGMGKETEDGAEGRYWYGNVDTSRSTVVPPGLVTTMGTFGAIPVKIIKFNEEIWAIGHNQISYWTGSAWTSVKTDFANPTDAMLWFNTNV